MCKRLLFPAPDSPTMASISPFLTWKVKFSKSTNSACPDLYTFLSPLTRRISGGKLPCSIGCTGPPQRCRHPWLPAFSLPSRHTTCLPVQTSPGKVTLQKLCIEMSEDFIKVPNSSQFLMELSRSQQTPNSGESDYS